MTPTVGSAKVVNFTCDLISDLTAYLYFDVDRKLVKYGLHDWQPAIWGENLITWAIVEDGSVLSFIFQRKTGKLIVEGVTGQDFNASGPTVRLKPLQCTSQF